MNVFLKKFTASCAIFALLTPYAQAIPVRFDDLPSGTRMALSRVAPTLKSLPQASRDDFFRKHGIPLPGNSGALHAAQTALAQVRTTLARERNPGHAGSLTYQRNALQQQIAQVRAALNQELDPGHAGSLTHQRDALQQRIAAMLNIHDPASLASRLQVSEAEVLALRAQLDDSDATSIAGRLKAAQDEVTRLTADLTAAHDDSDATSIAGKLKIAQDEVARLTADLTKAHDDSDATSIAGKLKAAEAEVQRLGAQLDDTDATSIAGRLKAAQDEVARLTADLTKAHDDSDATSIAGKLKVAETEVQRLTADLTKAHDDSDATSIAGRLKIAQDEVQRLGAQLDDTDASSIAGRLKAAQDEVARLTADLTKAHDDSDATSIAGKLKAAQDEVQRLGAQLDDTDATSIAGRLKAAQDEVQRLTADLTKAHDDSDATSIAGKLKVAETEVQRLTADLTKAHDDSDATSIAGKLKIAQDEVQRLAQEKSDLETALQEDANEIEEKAQQILQLQQELVKAKDAHQEQIDAITDDSDATSIAGKLKAAQDEVQRLTTDLTKAHDDSDATSIAGKLKAAEAEVQRLAQEKSDLETALQEDANEIEEKAQQILQLQQELVKAKDAHQEQIDAINDDSDATSIAGKLKAAETEVQRLTASLATVQEALTLRNIENDALKKVRRQSTSLPLAAARVEQRKHGTVTELSPEAKAAEFSKQFISSTPSASLVKKLKDTIARLKNENKGLGGELLQKAERTAQLALQEKETLEEQVLLLKEEARRLHVKLLVALAELKEREEEDQREEKIYTPEKQRLSAITKFQNSPEGKSFIQKYINDLEAAKRGKEESDRLALKQEEELQFLRNQISPLRWKLQKKIDEYDELESCFSQQAETFVREQEEQREIKLTELRSALKTKHCKELEDLEKEIRKTWEQEKLMLTQEKKLAEEQLEQFQQATEARFDRAVREKVEGISSRKDQEIQRLRATLKEYQKGAVDL